MVDSQKYDFVGVLCRHIRLQPGKKNEIIRELEGHLEDKASDLVDRGVGGEAAKRLALQQMGDPVALAKQMQAVHTSVGLKEMGLAVIFPGCRAGSLQPLRQRPGRGCDPGADRGYCLVQLASGPAQHLVPPLDGIYLGRSGDSPADVGNQPGQVAPGSVGRQFLSPEHVPGGAALCLRVSCIVGNGAGCVPNGRLRLAAGSHVRLPDYPLDCGGAGCPVAGPFLAGSTGPGALPGALWIGVFLSIAALTAAFLKFGRCHAKVGHLLISTSVAITVAYAILLMNYHLFSVRLAIAGLMAILLFPALKKPLVSSLRVLQNAFQTTLHLIGR